jgi:hypothetical protein
MKPEFEKSLNQKITIVNDKYAFLDNSTVLYTVNVKSLINRKDGSSSLADPEVMQFIFKNINSKWRVIYYVDSYVDKTVPSETSKELNQVELLKQILGTWKAEIAKDTFYIAQYKWFATGMEGTIKIVTKGKTITEGRAIIGYDKKSDKIVETDLIEGSDIMIYGLWFTSKNTCTEIPWKDISNPENTPVTWKYELKSPDLFIWNTIENNKTTLSYTFHREK